MNMVQHVGLIIFKIMHTLVLLCDINSVNSYMLTGIVRCTHMLCTCLFTNLFKSDSVNKFLSICIME